MSQRPSSLSFYKYLRLAAILIGIGVIVSCKVFALGEPIDFGFEVHQLHELGESMRGINVEGDDGRTYQIRGEGSDSGIYVYDEKYHTWVPYLA